MKKISAILLALIGVLGLAGCNKQPSGDPPAAEVKTFDISGAEKLTVKSGSTGESMDITSAEDIEYMTDNINALEYSKGEEVNSDGWSYALQWYNANGETIEKLTLLGDGHTIIFDGYYYKGMSADYEIDLSFLEEQFAASPVAFVPAVMYNGDIYCTTENQLAGEVDERAIVGEINSGCAPDTMAGRRWTGKLRDFECSLMPLLQMVLLCWLRTNGHCLKSEPNDRTEKAAGTIKVPASHDAL